MVNGVAGVAGVTWVESPDVRKIVGKDIRRENELVANRRMGDGIALDLIIKEVSKVHDKYSCNLNTRHSHENELHLSMC